MHDCATGQSWKTGVKLSFLHLLPSNVKLRSSRSDGPYFDSLTVFEGGAAFGYLHRLLNTVCLNTRWYGNTNRGGGSGEGLPSSQERADGRLTSALIKPN